MSPKKRAGKRAVTKRAAPRAVPKAIGEPVVIEQPVPGEVATGPAYDEGALRQRLGEDPNSILHSTLHEGLIPLQALQAEEA